MILSVKDANGQWISVKEKDLIETFTENQFTICGMNIHVLLAIREEYIKQGGKIPMTEDSVKEIFSN